MYGVRRPGSFRVVDVTPGPGMAALQCVREWIPRVAFCLPSQADTLRLARGPNLENCPYAVLDNTQ